MSEISTDNEVKAYIDELLSKPYKLILHNDSKNTFEYVIECLMKICGCEYVQSEQIAHIVHFKGECDVKYGYKEELDLMKEKLRNLGLSATIEQN